MKLDCMSSLLHTPDPHFDRHELEAIDKNIRFSYWVNSCEFGTDISQHKTTGDQGV